MCEYCKHHGKPSEVIWDTHILYMLGEDKKDEAFIRLNLECRKNEANLISESQSENNMVNKITVPINYCPICR